MSTLVKPVSPPMLLYAAIVAAGVAVVVTGIYIFPFMIDEAHITYSYARNLARIGSLVYHPTNPYFSVGAPLYAVLLGIGGKLGVPIPVLSNALSAASIFGSSVYLMLLCFRHRMMWAAATAGLLLATSPILWLTLGLETCFFLLLVLAAFYHFDRGNFKVGAMLTACAVLTRWEGVLVAGVLGFSHFILIGLRKKPSLAATVTYSVGVAFAILFIWSLSDLYAHGEYVGAAIAALVTVASALTGKRGDPPDGASGLNHSTVVRPTIPWNAVVAFFVVLLPAIFYLAVSFGPTLPTTFQTQQGQATIGYTGFGIGTSLAGGLQIMLRGWLDQSSLYFSLAPFYLARHPSSAEGIVEQGRCRLGRIASCQLCSVECIPFHKGLCSSGSSGRTPGRAGSPAVDRVVTLGLVTALSCRRGAAVSGSGAGNFA